jgi:LL-diaminopimelate aminotransferase
LKFKASKRVESLPVYAFELVQDRVQALRDKGITPIDFGVGDPSTPTPKLVRDACKEALDSRSTSGYPSDIGTFEFRQAVAQWTKRRFGIEVDPATEVSSTIGSKEGIFNFHEALVDPGDTVLIPSPGYPPYSRGTWFAEGNAWFYPLDEKNGFLPDLDAIPDEVARSAKILWVNYPHSPSGTCPDLNFYKKVYAWTKERNIILASDEAYSEFYFGDTPPPSAIEAGREGVIVFNSLSKRSAMTTYRMGWVVGDPKIIEIFRKMKTNIDSGTPTFIQDAAIVALSDEQHVKAMCEEYRQKRDIMLEALAAAGLPLRVPQGTLYIWQRVPNGMTSMDFAARLMEPEVAIVCTPGNLIAEETKDGYNPGEGYVRFALTPTIEETMAAANKIAKLKFLIS